MPVYEYMCIKCKYKFEKIHKINQSYFILCFKCKNLLIKIISFSFFKLKGTGWYETDFKKK